MGVITIGYLKSFILMNFFSINQTLKSQMNEVTLINLQKTAQEQVWPSGLLYETAGIF